MTNRRQGKEFSVKIGDITHLVTKDEHIPACNWATQQDDVCLYQLDPAKYVAIKNQVSKVKQYYLAEAETRLTLLFDGLMKRLERPTDSKPSDINKPKKWATP